MSEIITQDILTQTVEEVRREYGRINLSALERRLPLTRAQLRRLQEDGFIMKPHGNNGKTGSRKLSGFEDVINEEYLRRGITNSQVIYDSISMQGYKGGLTTVKNYIAAHSDLVPAPRILASESKNKNRGRRYETGPGEMFQMDWGFVNVEDGFGTEWQCACFAMVCHHCGLRFIEFFPSARQENLFIGMLHGFSVMGIPNKIYTDNMKSVVAKRLSDGTPIWNKEYEAFQRLLGFRTAVHKIAHPWSKGKVERLVKHVKDNFIQGKRFINLTDLNNEALNWCCRKNTLATRHSDHVPMETHYTEENLRALPEDGRIIPYLSPMRKISYDGFVNYENRQYGVPMRFSGKDVRVKRTGDVLQILAPETFEILYTHKVDWSKKPKTCIGQWSHEQPEEHPTQEVRSSMRFETERNRADRFCRFSILQEGGSR